MSSQAVLSGKQSLCEDLAPQYEPSVVEQYWDDWWSSQGLYAPRPLSSAMKGDAGRFVMVIPPPNVTGTLHLGHALTCSIEDALTRWHRMSGRETLWVPGTDHAGIATQAVVEKQLMRERGLLRTQLPREEFVRRVWQWKEQSGTTINQQIRRMGASVDWSRERFTMDAQCSAAVQEAFIRLHQQGRIYRADKLVNWSCALKTAISQIEVDYLNLEGSTQLQVPGHAQPVQFGVLHTFAYPVVPLDHKQGEESKELLLVSTTRIETMLGDVAVAVHSADARYKRFHGRLVSHPLLPGRRLPVICDDTLVDMTYGSGVVKITPAHDQNDYDCAKRHSLPMINVFNDDGTLNEACGAYQGLPRFVARERIIAELTAQQLYRGCVPNPMVLGICSRSGDVIEPMLRAQWWMDCDELAGRAVEAVETGQLQLIPAEYNAVWYEWLKNIHHWCISRQLWWGHRIPAWRVHLRGVAQPDQSQSWVVADDDVEALEKARLRFSQQGHKAEEVSVVQDEDVLDTWFSSALFPFSVMGWPNVAAADYQRFYPTSLLETGHDILFFWVARMVMMGMALTQTLPFKQVYLHPMVRDKLGRKMSKSLGNIIDPVHVMNGISLESLHQQLLDSHLPIAEKQRAIAAQKADYPNGIPACGSDALRFGLLAYTAQAHDINLDIQRIIAYRQFGNKLWQAHRFAFKAFQEAGFGCRSVHEASAPASASFAERWILSRLAACVAKINSALHRFDFAQATTACYDFCQYQLCDIYLELIKPACRLQAPESRTALSALFLCQHTALRLLHPFMPFITEELFQRLQTYGHPAEPLVASTAQTEPLSAAAAPVSVMVSPFPSTQEFVQLHDPEAEGVMHLIQKLAHASRAMRSTSGLTRSKADLLVSCTDDLQRQLQPQQQHIITLGKLQSLAFSTAPPSTETETQPDNRDGERQVVIVSLASTLQLRFSWSPADTRDSAAAAAVSRDASAQRWRAMYKREQRQWELEESLTSLQSLISHPSFAAKEPQVQQQRNQQLLTGQQEVDHIKDLHLQAVHALDAEHLRLYREYRQARVEEDILRLEEQLLRKGALSDHVGLAAGVADSAAKPSVKTTKLLQQLQLLRDRRQMQQDTPDRMNVEDEGKE